MSNFKEEIKNVLLKIPTARVVSGGREILMRCRYCQDSKTMSSAHMYVSLPNDNDVMFHNCYKCHSKGIVTHDKLIQWGCFDDPDVLVKLSKYNKHVLSLEKNMKFRDSNVYILNNTYITDNALSQKKLEYINKRLGINLSYKDALDEKIVLNMKDLYINNNIKEFTRSQYIIDQLDEAFIGFISKDNAFLNMRRLIGENKVHKSIDKRYINYNIFNKFENTERYYMIPTDINLCNPKRIKVNISEGPFDTLSIYHNLRNKEPHSIYASILGSSYYNIVTFFILVLKLINIEVHIYIDNDIEMKSIYPIQSLLNDYYIPLYLHRNIKPGEKDFGVTLDRIDEQIFKL